MNIKARARIDSIVSATNQPFTQFFVQSPQQPPLEGQVQDSLQHHYYEVLKREGLNLDEKQFRRELKCCNLDGCEGV